MAVSCTLLSLPTELREVILRYAFSCIPHVRVRSPSHRRLRPSRIGKNDPQGLLSTCHTLREESIPIFYASTTIIFHSSSDAIEYLEDIKIDPFVKANLTHLAMDDGDCQCMVASLQKHLWLVGNAFDICKALRALEFRIYSRHDNQATVAAARNLITDWRALAANCTYNSGHGNPISLTKRIRPEEDEDADDAINRLLANDHDVRVFETHATYLGGMTTMSNSPSIMLSCCNMVIDKNGRTQPVLGDAKEAVERRKVRVGVSRQGTPEYDTDTRCPDRREIQFMKELEDSLTLARDAAKRGVGRYAWSATRMLDSTAEPNPVRRQLDGLDTVMIDA